jgi:hypothetical protein
VPGERRVEPVVDGPPVGEPGELVGVGEPGHPVQVLALGQGSGQLRRDGQRVVAVRDRVGRFGHVPGHEQLTPDPPLEVDRHGQAGALAEPLQQAHQRRVVAG